MGRGGVTGSGGAPSTGGATGRGGVTGSGGAPGTGGAPGSGGTAGTSGTTGAGGSPGSGGATGNGGAADGGSRDGGTTTRDAADPNTPDAGEGGSGGFDPCPATGNCKILPLGDSITAGAGAQPGDNGGYRVELFTKAVNDNRHITFVGSLSSGPSTVAGATFPKNHEGHIGWTITQINNIATTAQTVSVSGTSSAGALRDMPNIVLLFIGTNDEGYASSEAGASDRLATLIDKIVAALPNALLVVSSIYPFPGCQSTNYTPTQCAANVATYDAAIPGIIQQRAAQGKHVLFVDMSTPPTGALSTDGVHPNDTVGYPWMGDNWYTLIKSYLH
jgi:lysophospholipase L1-like esterase